MSDTETAHCSSCTHDQLEALYQVNVEAKRYAASASDAYDTGWKTQAHHHSLRKRALYDFKRSILGTLVERGCVDAVRLHEIDGREYYCLYVSEFAFHSPISEWEEPPAEELPSSPRTIEDFGAAVEDREDRLSEREALSRLCEEHGTPNDHLPKPFVQYHARSEFTGWSELPGAIEQGDRVDDPPEHAEPFLFEIGDEFDTTEGRCRIRDRSYAWLTPWLDSSPVLPRPTYSVVLDGEEYEMVRQDRLLDDWFVLADSLDDPLPDVAGEQGEIAGREYDRSAPFEIGDVVEVDPTWDDSGPYYWQITRASVSHSLVFCEFEPVGPTDSCEPSLAVEEFVDDVVAVYDSSADIE